MNAAALATYQAIRRDGTQKNVLASMQTREELYRYLDYHAYEDKLDHLFAAERQGGQGLTQRTRHESKLPSAPKPKKSVALSGVVAGNTALCTVGRSGNDLHYRGYDILEIATTCEFEEIAYLLMHEKLPNVRELAAYRAKLAGLRGLPAAAQDRCWRICRPRARRWTCCAPGCRCSGCLAPEAAAQPVEGARDIADRLLASLGSDALLLASLQPRAAPHRGRDRRRLDRRALPAPAARTAAPSARVGARHAHLAQSSTPSTSSTPRPSPRASSPAPARTCIRAITGAIGALRGPKHGGANEVAFEIQNRYRSPTKPRPTSAAAWPPRRSSSASVIRSTPSPIRAMSSSRSVARGLAHDAAEQEPVCHRRAARER